MEGQAGRRALIEINVATESGAGEPRRGPATDSGKMDKRRRHPTDRRARGFANALRPRGSLRKGAKATVGQRASLLRAGQGRGGHPGACPRKPAPHWTAAPPPILDNEGSDIFSPLWSSADMAPIVEGRQTRLAGWRQTLDGGRQGRAEGQRRRPTTAGCDLSAIATALDEYRRLGEVDWRLNYGYKPEPAAK